MTEINNQAEQPAHLLEAKYGNLVEHSNDGIIIIQNGRLVFVNRKMVELTAYPIEEVVGKPFLDFITPKYKQVVANKYESRVKGEAVPNCYHAEISAGNGAAVEIEINASLIEYEGKPAVMAIVRDIREQSKIWAALEKMVEDRTNELAQKNLELEKSNLQLQELDHLKSVFLAGMSHELRTPLNSIIGFTSVILQGMSGPINDEQKTQLTIVKNNAGHLLDLINDLIDMAKIEAGKVDLSHEEFDFKDSAKEVIDSFSPAAAARDITFIVEIPDEIRIVSDRKRVKQILHNLISNAIKFTDKGSIGILARTVDSNLECSVTDTGKGIAVDEIYRLFQPFQQNDQSLLKKYPGAGLGLYLCKKLLDALEGKISVKSSEGQGSTFTFTLPLKS
jgi:PAS domain S-box-containing protein